MPMTFGLSIAPFTWTKVCRPVVARLRELAVVIMASVDDLGGLHQ